MKPKIFTKHRMAIIIVVLIGAPLLLSGATYAGWSETESISSSATVTSAKFKITTTEVPVVEIGVPYSYQLETNATRGINVTWSDVHSLMPSGFALSSDGLITGTSTSASESANVTFGATATNGMTVTPVVIAFRVESAPKVSSALFPTASSLNAVINKPISEINGEFTGYPAPTVSIKSGVLPAGLSFTQVSSLSTTSMSVEGTPTVSTEGMTVVFTASNAHGSVDVAYIFQIVGPPTITTATLPEGIVGIAYSANLEGTGEGVVYAVSLGALPEGLTINATTGVISGTPTGSGMSTFTVTKSNTGGIVAQALSIDVKVVVPTSVMASTWNTSLPGCTTITLPLGGAIDAIVNWGDGQVSPASAMISHTYADTAGLHTITINGTFGSWGASTGWNSTCVKEVSQWGGTGTTSLANAFRAATNLTAVTEVPAGVTDMSFMFANTFTFNGVVDYDTSNVTNMEGMFFDARAFNQPFTFDTSNVTDMTNMFNVATSFNQPVTFDTSNVTDMMQMFDGATSFNQPVTFDTSNVTDMSYMFASATSFNQSVTLDTSKVITMAQMFSRAKVFNQPLPFNTVNVKNMDAMFYQASAFNQNLRAWNVSKVTSKMSFRSGSPLTVANAPLGF